VTVDGVAQVQKHPFVVVIIVGIGCYREINAAAAAAAVVNICIGLSKITPTWAEECAKILLASSLDRQHHMLTRINSDRFLETPIVVDNPKLVDDFKGEQLHAAASNHVAK
jgi:hypothetical protein